MAITSSMFQNNKANTVKKTFSRETSISIEIKAASSVIWALLTNAADYPRWNSTIISIDGNISAGEKINLRSAMDPKRTFKLKVKELDPENKLVWGGAMGTRTYTLNKKDRVRDEDGQEKGIILFCMKEKIGGPLFPLFAKMIPSFDKSFEQFATDLKKESEHIMDNK
jgi:uncharacterized protein YndB with AHSA1/START domain